MPLAALGVPQRRLLCVVDREATGARRAPEGRRQSPGRRDAWTRWEKGRAVV